MYEGLYERLNQLFPADIFPQPRAYSPSHFGAALVGAGGGSAAVAPLCRFYEKEHSRHSEAPHLVLDWPKRDRNAYSILQRIRSFIADTFPEIQPEIYEDEGKYSLYGTGLENFPCAAGESRVVKMVERIREGAITGLRTELLQMVLVLPEELLRFSIPERGCFIELSKMIPREVVNLHGGQGSGGSSIYSTRYVAVGEGGGSGGATKFVLTWAKLASGIAFTNVFHGFLNERVAGCAEIKESAGNCVLTVTLNPALKELLKEGAAWRAGLEELHARLALVGKMVAQFQTKVALPASTTPSRVVFRAGV